MRIAGGSLKGRPIGVPAGRGVRPTAAKVRAALFDILTHHDWPAAIAPGADGWPFAQVLDAFAGSGALGIEALSRGADHATFFETDPRHLDGLRQSLAALDLSARASVRRSDALRPPPATSVPADLVLLDPPYGRGLAAPATAALDRAGWIGRAAVLVVELPRREAAPAPDGFQTVIDRRYGDTHIVVLSRAA